MKGTAPSASRRADFTENPENGQWQFSRPETRVEGNCRRAIRTPRTVAGWKRVRDNEALPPLVPLPITAVSHALRLREAMTARPGLTETRSRVASHRPRATRAKTALISLGGRLSLGLGSILEQLGQREAKSGDQVAAVELARLGQDPNQGWRGIDIDLASYRIDDPDLLGARPEVIDQLLGDLVGGVRIADDLDGQVGDDIPGLGPGELLRERPLFADTKARSGRRLSLPARSSRNMVSTTTRPSFRSLANAPSSCLRAVTIPSAPRACSPAPRRIRGAPWCSWRGPG